jgi:hypothetical protein
MEKRILKKLAAKKPHTQSTTPAEAFSITIFSLFVPAAH